jgi:hypothetical protein
VLARGAHSFPRTLLLADEFKDALSSLCRRATRKHLDRFGKACGRKIALASLKEDTSPNGIWGEWAGDTAWIGITFPLIGFGDVFVGAVWNYGEQREEMWSLSVGVSVTPTSRFREIAFRTLGRIGGSIVLVERRWGLIWVGDYLSPTRMDQFERRLSQALAQWIHIWNSTGGIRGLTLRKNR